MAKLYELSERYHLIEGMLGKDFEAITKEEILQTLANIQDEIGQKVGSIAKLILELKAEGEVIKTEEDRLARRRMACTNKADWLRTYLLSEMEKTGTLKVKQDVVTVSVRNSPASIEVETLCDIPHEFVRIIPEQREADKKAILEHFKKTGEIVPGVNVITNRTYLEVR